MHFINIYCIIIYNNKKLGTKHHLIFCNNGPWCRLQGDNVI